MRCTRRQPLLILLALLLALPVWAGPGASGAAAAVSAAGAYVPVPPARILDTRDGNGAPAARVAPGATVLVQVTGRGGVPADGVAAVALNVTVTAPTSAGFITAYPSDASTPNASNVNYGPGETVPNLAVVKVGADGGVRLTNTSTGGVHLVADVAGYFLAGPASLAGMFTAVTPARVLDTRTGNGAALAKVPANGTVTLTLAGRGGLPASGIGAVVLNVTVTNPTRAGFVTVYPAGTKLPIASNVNYGPGQTVPNLVTVKTSSTGRVTLKNTSSGTVDLVADVAGYFRAGATTAPGAFTPVEPTRLLDTRIGNGFVSGPVPAGGHVSLQVTGRGGLPTSGVAAVVLNVTVTQPRSAGFITVHPSGQPLPNASNLNFGPDQTVPNLVVVMVGGDGRVVLHNTSTGTVELVADLAGYVLSESSPARIVSATPIQGYDSPTDAAAGSGITTVLRAGPYYVYASEEGMTNITNTPDQPGVWVDPALFDKRPDAPDPTLTRYANTQIDWSGQYPAAGEYGYPALGGFYRYEDGLVHLTFSLGYEYKNLTTVILNTLRAKGVHATFYVTGTYIRDNPALVARMLSDGHLVANHSMMHPNMVTLLGSSLQAGFDDFRAWEEQYRTVIGAYPSLWKYRPPSTTFSERVVAMAWSLGYVTELWEVAIHDWDTSDQLSPAETMSRLTGQTKQGSIVLLHTVSETNATILGDYIDYIHDQGWQIAEP